MNIYEKKLQKSQEITNSCRELRGAYLKTLHPELSEKEILKLIAKETLERKEKQWLRAQN